MVSLNALAAFAGVLILGILQGILLAALLSVLLVIAQYSVQHVTFWGAFPAPRNTPMRHVIPTTNRWLVRSPSGPKLRCSISTLNMFWHE